VPRSKFEVRHFSTLTVRSSHLTFVFLCQLPIFFQRRTLHTIAFHTAQERWQRRVTLSVCAKVEFETCANFRHCSTPTVRSSRLTFAFSLQTSVFLSPTYTIRQCPPDHARKTSAARDLHCHCQGQSLKFRHFSTNDRAEFPSNIRISGTSSHFSSPAYTTYKFPSDHARKTRLVDLHYLTTCNSNTISNDKFSSKDRTEF